MLKYGKPGRGLLWVTCLESVSLTARLRLNCASLPKFLCFFNCSQKSLNRLTHPLPHFYIVFFFNIIELVFVLNIAVILLAGRQSISNKKIIRSIN